MKKPSLAELQYWMKSRIQKKGPEIIIPEILGRGSNPHDSHRESATEHRRIRPKALWTDSPELCGECCGNDILKNKQRLSVYAEGYEIRFRDGLAEVYEAVRWVIGETLFAELAKIYAVHHPSRNYNLSFVGEHLPEFISTLPLAKEMPFIADLARLEWLICEVFHAFDNPPIGVNELSKLSPEALTQAVLIFQPSVAAINSQWPVLDIWNLRKKPKEKVELQIEGNAQRVVVFRRDLKVECKLLTEWQLEMFEGLLNGLTLEAACEKLAENFSDDLRLATEWFSSLIQDGLIVQIVV